MNKQCQMCNITKLIDNFSPSKQTKDGLFSYCKPCKYQANKKSDSKRLSENRIKFLEQRKNWHLKTTYGITLEHYKELLAKQNGKCAICKMPEADELYRRLAVDHCHDTLKVRGLLCHRCNRGIGMFKNSVDNLRSAIVYLSS